MDAFLLLDLVRGLDGRPLQRMTTEWAGFFEGVISVAGIRRVGDEVYFTLSVPTTRDDVNAYIRVDATQDAPPDRVRLQQEGRRVPSTVQGVVRTGVDPGWLPGPEAYQFRMRVEAPEGASRAPLVVQILDPDQSTVLAEATGLPPVREDLNEILTTGVISRPLMELLSHATLDETFAVVIDVNLQAATDETRAVSNVRHMVSQVLAGDQRTSGRGTEQYVFEKLTKAEIQALVALDRAQTSDNDRDNRGSRSIHRIWPDFQVHALIDTSIPTIKADAACTAFSATGRGIRWAVIDSGIGHHSHFTHRHNLDLTDPNIKHRDFLTGAEGPAALVDEFGHGTHVAGILAGEQAPNSEAAAEIRSLDENGNEQATRTTVENMRGVAPECELVSLRVLDASGNGTVTPIMEALDYVNTVNQNGRNIRIHGVNLSVGYEFDAEWFACGQSPLCIEVDRLVRTGVVVVVAAGNTGYGRIRATARPTASAGIDLTINDPGNAERAITVGSTHRSAPHTYGVSFYSSKGPTGDGRGKPDLVAPGERIMSCAAGTALSTKLGGAEQLSSLYVEKSGTSMAAPHVSGAAAAFLSIRREFVGQPERVKRLLVETATDLGRNPFFQGGGLLDLMRAIQAV